MQVPDDRHPPPGAAQAPEHVRLHAVGLDQVGALGPERRRRSLSPPGTPDAASAPPPGRQRPARASRPRSPEWPSDEPGVAQRRRAASGDRPGRRTATPRPVDRRAQRAVNVAQEHLDADQPGRSARNDRQEVEQAHLGRAAERPGRGSRKTTFKGPAQRTAAGRSPRPGRGTRFACWCGATPGTSTILDLDEQPGEHPQSSSQTSPQRPAASSSSRRSRACIFSPSLLARNLW